MGEFSTGFMLTLRFSNFGVFQAMQHFAGDLLIHIKKRKFPFQIDLPDFFSTECRSYRIPSVQSHPR